MSDRSLRLIRGVLVVVFVVALAAFLGRSHPSTYDDTWAALPLADAPPDSLRAADGRAVALVGYVVPLGVGRPERFLLSPFPPSCPFCQPGLASAVEVVAEAAPPAGDGTVVVRGTLSVRPDTEPTLALLDATARPAP
ncbi:MAG: hypothetical protein AAF845_02640 [Bacteroidota bacterium]